MPRGTGPFDALGLPVPDGWSGPVATDRASLVTLEEEFDLRCQTARDVRHIAVAAGVR